MTSPISLQLLSDADQALLSGGQGHSEVRTIISSTHCLVSIKQVCAIGDGLVAKAEDIKEAALDYAEKALKFAC